MDLLGMMRPVDWINLFAALFLLLGPGYGLLSFYPDRTRFDKTQKVIAAIGLSISFWPILLAWLQGLGIALTPIRVYAILSTGWAVGLFRTRTWLRRDKTPETVRTSRDTSRIVLWGVFILTAAAGIWALRNTVFGPGSDSYHHTLIAQMIVDRGILPNDYQPYAPLVTFTYHFGFHGLVAATSWLTNLETLVLVPILGAILNAAAALSVAFFTQAMVPNRQVATASAAFTGLVSVFPGFYANWGRYTQLTGLVILPVFLGLVWSWSESDSKWSPAAFVGILAAGIALVHYRVTLMAALAVLVLVGFYGLSRKIGLEKWKQAIGRLTLAAVIAGVLIAPWVWHLLSIYLSGATQSMQAPLRPRLRTLAWYVWEAGCWSIRQMPR